MLNNLVPKWPAGPGGQLVPGLAAIFLQDADTVLSNWFITGFILIIILAMCAGALISWMLLKPASNSTQEESPADWQFEHSPVALWEEDWSDVLHALPEGWSISGLSEAQVKAATSAVKAGLNQLHVRSVNQAARQLTGTQNVNELGRKLSAAYHELPLDQLRQLLHDLTHEPNSTALTYHLNQADYLGTDLHVRWQVTPGSENSLASVIVAAEPMTTSSQIF